jgi:hypothetical protein
MATSARSSLKALNAAGIGSVDLAVEERGEGQPFLVLHGGAGPQSVAEFAELLAERTAIGSSRQRTRASAARLARID